MKNSTSPLMADCITKHVCTVAALLFAFFYHLTLAGPYNPIENILINCGASSQLKDLEQRNWFGDINSKLFASDLNQNAESLTLEASTNPVDQVPYMTARLSRSEFTYSIPVSPGQKFIRLHFYPHTYNPNFDRYKAVFSVRIGLYTLLRDFNASVNADASNLDVFFREFCVSVEENDRKLNLTFIPMNHDSYAFINGIEIVSTPTNLYHTPPESNEKGGRGLRFVGQSNMFFPIENYTFLETVYRMNIGGRSVSPVDDTGMFRTWSEERYLLDGSSWDARPTNTSINLVYSKIQPYAAPKEVYITARTMGPNATENKKYNLTWEYPIDPGFFYMIRLHFCEFQSEINDASDRVFLIYIKHMIAESFADVFRWTGGKGSPYYRDYVVLVSSSNVLKKVNLSVELQPNPDDSLTRFSNVILNGVEIFKLNDSSGNLGGQNPDPPLTVSHVLPLPRSSTGSESLNTKTVVIVIYAAVGGVVFVLALTLFVFWRYRIFHDQASSPVTSWLTSFAISTNKSSKTPNSNLPSDSYRYFSLSETEGLSSHR